MHETVEAIDQAILRTKAGMKMKKKKKKVPDLFPSSPLFDFSDDIILNKARKRRHQTSPSQIEKWKDSDFLSFLSKKLNSNTVITNAAYDKNQFLRLKDKLTNHLEKNTDNKKAKCDNRLLKTYIDWWIEACSKYYIDSGAKISIDFFYKENHLRDFFQTSSWLPTQTPHVNSGSTNQKKGVKTSCRDTYRSGGINRLLYDMGIVDSHYYLSGVEGKNDSQSIQELKLAMFKMHEAVLSHVFEKTFRQKYDAKKKFDLVKLLKSVINKRKMYEWKNYDFDSVFEN